MRAQESSGKYLLLVQLVLSAALTLALFYPNLSASFGLVDDHQIIVNLGPDRQLPVSELPGRILASEAGLSQTGLARYRPAYWIIFFCEAALWGADPQMWYCLRLFLVFASVFTGWYLMARLFGRVFSAFSCLFLFTLPYWADIGARLGPAELYAVFGVSVYSLSFYKLWNGKAGVWWALLAFGAFISFGSKENFLFLVPVTAALFYRHRKEGRRLGAAGAASGIFIAATGVLIGTVVIVILSGSGADIYGGSVNPVERVAARLFSKWNIAAAFPLALSLLLPIGARRLRLSYSAQDHRRLILAELVLFFLWESQFFFYSGKLPTISRYDFPGMFILGLSYVFLVHALLKALEAKRAVRTAFAAIMAAAVLATSLAGSFFIHRVSVDNMIKTGRFISELERISLRLKSDPQTPVILESHYYYDFEPVISFSRYLFYYGVSNTAGVHFTGETGREDKSPLALMLTKRMEDLENGEKDIPQDRLPFRPYRPLKDNRCFSVSFSGEDTPGCIDLGRIW